LFSDKDDAIPHPNFENSGLGEYSDTSDQVVFQLKEEVEGTFSYFLKGTALGGSEVWSEQLIFNTVCEYGSTSVIKTDEQDHQQWVAVGDQMFF